MRIEKFPSSMHPEQKHAYAFNFTKALAAIGDGTDTVNAGPTVIVIGTTPPGFTATGVSVQNDTKVIFTADVDTGDHEDAAYANDGVEICLQCNGVSSSGDDLVQQAFLRITDRC